MHGRTHAPVTQASASPLSLVHAAPQLSESQRVLTSLPEGSTPSERLLLLALAALVDQDGHVEITIRDLSSHCGLQERQTRDLVRGLEQQGALLVIERRGRGRVLYPSFAPLCITVFVCVYNTI